MSLPDLTPAELRELRYAAQGYTAKDASTASGRAVYTVKSLRKLVIRKARARNITHAVYLYLKAGAL